MNVEQLRHKARGTGGQSVLELALVLPILLMLVVGITEFGRAWMTVNVLTGAVREGARVASVTPDLAQNVDVVRSAVTTLLTDASLQPNYVRIAPEPSMQNVVRVESAVDFAFIPVPFVQLVFGTGYTFVRSASCYYEGQI